MSMTKAMIIAIRGSKEEKIPVLFNPNEYTINMKNQYDFDSTPGGGGRVGQYVNKEGSLSLELFFDTYEKRMDVRQYTDRIARLLEIDESIGAPPLCRFIWGSFSYTGYIETLNQRFTMFLESGCPVRAWITITITACDLNAGKVADQRQETQVERERVVEQGDQLCRIAQEEYQDPNQWRKIAKENRITNPLKLKTGMKLQVSNTRSR